MVILVVGKFLECSPLNSHQLLLRLDFYQCRVLLFQNQHVLVSFWIYVYLRNGLLLHLLIRQKSSRRVLFKTKKNIKKSDKFILLGKLHGFYLTEYSDYLRKLVKIGLILSPSNSRVKCVFLINGTILETNLKNVSVELFICIENCL